MPTFGNTTWVTGTKGSSESRVFGIKAQMGSMAGVAQSITANILCNKTDAKFKCALYDEDGNFVGETEEKTIPNTGATDYSTVSYTFNFASPKPALVSNAYYYIVSWCQGPLDGVHGIRTEDTGVSYYYGAAYNSFPETVPSWSTWTPHYAHIYCTYATATTKADCEAGGCYWYNDTCNSTPFFGGTFDVYVSGFLQRFQKRQIVGYFPTSGDLRSITCNASGHLYIDVEVEVSSGQHVVISGQHVHLESGDTIDAYVKSGSVTDAYLYGQHVLSGDWRPISVCSSGEVVVCSGLYVVADIAESGIGVQVQSGLHVIMSGQHFFQESGAFVTTQPGIAVSGTVQVQSGVVDVREYGYHILSGEWRPKAVCDSGEIVVCSGLYVVIESGIGVTTDPATAGSGQIIHVGCADTIRTGKLVQVVGGTSGSVVGSGGMSLCVSGYWCSGPIHTIIIKNLADNDPVFVGEVNCKPYSGYGFLLAASEAINFDYCSVCDVYVFAQTSGQFITWIGTDY